MKFARAIAAAAAVILSAAVQVARSQDDAITVRVVLKPDTCGPELLRRLTGAPQLIQLVLKGNEIIDSAGNPTLTPYGQVPASERPSWRSVEPGDDASQVVIGWIDTVAFPTGYCVDPFDLELTHEQVHDWVTDPKRSGCTPMDLIFIQTSCNEHPLLGEGAFNDNTTTVQPEDHHDHEDYWIWFIIIIVLLSALIICVAVGMCLKRGGSKDSMKITVKVEDQLDNQGEPVDELVVLEVEPSHSVDQVKLMIQAKRKPPILSERQKIIFAGEVLRDTWTLSEYNIRSGATVHLHEMDEVEYEGYMAGEDRTMDLKRPMRQGSSTGM